MFKTMTMMLIACLLILINASVCSQEGNNKGTDIQLSAEEAYSRAIMYLGLQEYEDYYSKDSILRNVEYIEYNRPLIPFLKNHLFVHNVWQIPMTNVDLLSIFGLQDKLNCESKKFRILVDATTGVLLRITAYSNSQEVYQSYWDSVLTESFLMNEVAHGETYHEVNMKTPTLSFMDILGRDKGLPASADALIAYNLMFSSYSIVDTTPAWVFCIAHYIPNESNGGKDKISIRRRAAKTETGVYISTDMELIFPVEKWGK